MNAKPENHEAQALVDKPKPLSDEEVIERMRDAIPSEHIPIFENADAMARMVFAAVRAYEAATKGE